MSNADRQFHRRWAREAGIPWSLFIGGYHHRATRRRRQRPDPPVKFNARTRGDVEKKRKARVGWMGAAGRALATVFGFARRRT